MKDLKTVPIADFMIEGKEGYAFFDDIEEGEALIDLEKHGKTYATHGFSPEKNNYQCNLIITGPNLRQNHEIGSVEMVDIAPTMAWILNIEFPPCDGKVISEAFIE